MTETAELDPRTFDLFAVAQGRSYPQDIVDIYTDHDAAYQAAKIEKQIADEKDSEKVEVLDTERKTYIGKMKESRLTFHLKGLSQKAIRAIEIQADSQFGTEDTLKDGKPHQEKIRWRNYAWLAAHIADVYDAQDNRDSRVWLPEHMQTLQENLPTESFDKLFSQMSELTFRAEYFENIEVSPDFS